ncbi:CRISPR type II-A/NMEMI-associated protein Csn2 [Anaerostipes hadrus]|uniref:CRISPR type II-A/NMEMI-associated protein Csn2 n=1 Tax=Anaerostipes hadrus TaxID=649756 RepID=A0A174P9I9_ANAHA|nr:type II-A CRISPR-associated protein Csn2 [Anaerostipes hadrus]CUP57653.1 CRISPR type II-A/NMEMI-associated protein Csn2 [Anaerostipes hadrus]
MILVSHENGIESKMETERINAVILEDSEQYTKMIQELWNQIHKIDETLFLYGEENDLLDMSKQCDLLFSIRDLSLQNSRIQKKLITYLAEEIQMTELSDKVVKNQSELLQVAEDIKNLSEYPICVNEKYNMTDILKYLGVKLSETDGTFCEKLIDYMKISYDFLKIDIFFVVGCKGYLKEKDYEYLQEWIRYQQITLVLIESDEDRLPSDVNKYIIDRDRCVIH